MTETLKTKELKTVLPWLKPALWVLPLAWLWWTLINQLRVPWNLNPQYAYGWAVPFLCVYLLWQRIQGSRLAVQGPDLASVTHHASRITHLPSPVLGFLFALLAFLWLPTRLIQEANPEWSLVSWALALIVIGLTLLLVRQVPSANFHLRHLAFPLGFFLVAVPWPYLLENPVVQGLTRLNTAATIEILGWLGIPAVSRGNVIELATGEVGIDEACSGIRSLQATLMLSLFFGELYRLHVVRRVALCLAGFGLALVSNLGRTLLLTWVASRQGPEAIAGWHDPAGVTILVACFLGLWGIGAWMVRRKGNMPNIEPVGRESTRADPSPFTPDPSTAPTVGRESPRAVSPTSPTVGRESSRAVSPTSPTVGRESARAVSPTSPTVGRESSRAASSPLTPDSQASTAPSIPARREPCPTRELAISGREPVERESPRAVLTSTHRPPLRAIAIALLAWLLVVEVFVALWYRAVESKLHDAPTWSIAWPRQKAGYREVPIAAAAAKLLRFDEAKQAQWTEEDSTRWQVSWFHWFPGRAAGFLAKSHNPLVCMPAAGYQIATISDVQFTVLRGLRFPYRIYSFEQDGTRVHVLYSRWDDAAVEQSFATEGLTRFNRLRSVWSGRGNKGQRVISAAVWGARDPREAQELLVRQIETLVVDSSSPPPAK